MPTLLAWLPFWIQLLIAAASAALVSVGLAVAFCLIFRLVDHD